MRADLKKREHGFVMVALLIGMAVTAVWLSTMLPAWHQQAVREEEENLVFIGNQYATAIAYYYLKNNCQLPADADVLVEGHYLRKKWKDPITQKDFIPIMVGGTNTGSAPGQSGGAPGSGNGRQGGATPGGNPAQGQIPAGGNRGGGAPAGGAAPGRGGTPTGGGPVGGGQAALVGLMGVNSESTDTSIRLFNQQQQYNLWAFNMTTGMTLIGRSAACQNGQPTGGVPGTSNQNGNANGRGDGRGNGNGNGGPGGALPFGPGRGDGQGGPRQGGGNGPPPQGIGAGRGRGGF